MRRRRAERCLLRASAALDAEVPEAAAAVLEEARALCPEHPDLEAVTARLHTSFSAPQPPAAPARSGYWVLCGAAALLLVLGTTAGCGLGWVSPADAAMVLTGSTLAR